MIRRCLFDDREAGFADRVVLADDRDALEPTGAQLAVEAGLAVAIFLGESVNSWRVRELTDEEGFPRLPRTDVLLHSADHHLPRSTAELRNFLQARLADPSTDKRT